MKKVSKSQKFKSLRLFCICLIIFIKLSWSNIKGHFKTIFFSMFQLFSKHTGYFPEYLKYFINQDDEEVNYCD